ncbi:peptidase M22, glycoprotease [Meira miltonrushii]|uniref:N(6)-L-threonylcarbamoyladenine synthase n=1 Tax=Meira miltonrushii TaxID=1280837 RepID=A0A316VDX8_9BASI|nr:peptidase M22, glycoprotease [Meira miltonrushii]PWN35887.1 peptidase M22, glycoprotease [Meira miltonrushii]
MTYLLRSRSTIQICRNNIRHLTSDGRRLVLGIESSCDDSCAALVSAPITYPDGNFKERATIHTSIVRKQDHTITKGIEPLKATHSHSAELPIAIRDALQKAKEQGVIRDPCKPEEIDGIAVTQGPGMASCLMQGLTNAKLLSTLWEKPLIYCHHMVAHTLTPLLTNPVECEPIRLPFLVLLLSGGHTQLVLCSSYTEFKILAATTDTSIGDALDKGARELNVPFDWATTAPGAALERFADVTGSDQFPMPIPVRGKAEFSYSGLRAALFFLKQKKPEIFELESNRKTIAFSYQNAAFAQLQDKLQMVFSGKGSILPPTVDANSITDLVVSGGVASNAHLRQVLQSTLDKLDRTNVRLHFPPLSLCTDNAAMIAHAALVRWDPTNDLSMSPRARWSMEDYP